MKRIYVLVLVAMSLWAQAPAPKTVSIAEQPLPAVTLLSVVPTIVSGQDSYCYGVVTRYGVGNSQLSHLQCIDKIGSGSSIAVSWQAPASPTGTALTYDVMRLTNSTAFPSSGTCTNCLLSSATSSLSATDTLLSLSSYTIANYSLSSVVLSIDNTNTSNVLLKGLLNGVSIFQSNSIANGNIGSGVNTNLFIYRDLNGIFWTGGLLQRNNATVRMQPLVTGLSPTFQVIAFPGDTEKTTNISMTDSNGSNVGATFNAQIITATFGSRTGKHLYMEVFPIGTSTTGINWYHFTEYVQAGAAHNQLLGYVWSFGNPAGAGEIDTATLTKRGATPVADFVVTGYLGHAIVTVANLPTCSGTLEGSHYGVSDSNAASFTAGIGAIVTAGGTAHVPVYCDGTNWRIG